MNVSWINRTFAFNKHCLLPELSTCDENNSHRGSGTLLADFLSHTIGWTAETVYFKSVLASSYSCETAIFAP